AGAPPREPTVDGIRRLLKSHPDTVVLTCTRQGAHAMNELAMQALFPSGRPLVVLPADVDSNPDNYEDGQLLEDASALQSLQLPIYRGMRLVFTRNVRKDLDYVNGMDGKVLSFDPSTQALEVLTATGFRVMVWPWTDVERGDLTYYPIKAGYADKIMKFQGAELTHVTAFLDRAGIPGAAYTDFLIGGLVDAEHFQPVDALWSTPDASDQKDGRLTANGWESSQFHNSKERTKFLRLMGGQKFVEAAKALEAGVDDDQVFELIAGEWVEAKEDEEEEFEVNADAPTVELLA
ncbi:pif1, partial [Symbiodinium pilosum]